MPGRISQSERELRALENGSGSSSEEGDEEGDRSDGFPGSRAKKRKRRGTIDEIFENMDPEEKAEITKQYRKLQVQADGMFIALTLCIAHRDRVWGLI